MRTVLLPVRNCRWDSHDERPHHSHHEHSITTSVASMLLLWKRPPGVTWSESKYEGYSQHVSYCTVASTSYHIYIPHVFMWRHFLRPEKAGSWDHTIILWFSLKQVFKLRTNSYDAPCVGGLMFRTQRVYLRRRMTSSRLGCDWKCVRWSGP